MEKISINGIRETSPCDGCTRPWKTPGCHDTCVDFKKWKRKRDQVNAARREYEIRHKYKYLTK